MIPQALGGKWEEAAYTQAAQAYKDEPDNRPEKDMVSPSESWCAQCNAYKKITEFKKCARCKVTFYCDSTCQKANWPSHKADCVSPSSLHAMTIKLAERFMATPHLWIYLDIFAVLAFDLLKYPNRTADNAIIVSFVLVSTKNKARPKEVVLQVKSIVPSPLSKIPDGYAAFARDPRAKYPVGITLHNIYIQDGNPLLQGYVRTFQISRPLMPPVLNLLRSADPAAKMIPVSRFGINQVIPLQKDAIVKCINEAIRGDKKNELRLHTLRTD
ncbi:hypothetical protein C8J56DRAFT_962518 [Mycena floridula]|nr:hypothetical protein C8J56DRAFT_962518 [Mycena floridula]